jgi:hypothetical protein
MDMPDSGTGLPRLQGHVGDLFRRDGRSGCIPAVSVKPVTAQVAMTSLFIIVLSC